MGARFSNIIILPVYIFFQQLERHKKTCRQVMKSPGARTSGPGGAAGPFVPNSTRRPHWVLLGRASEFGRTPRLLDVHGQRLIAFRGADGRVMGLPDACPHRGASLSTGGVVNRQDCVVCPYHGRAVPGGARAGGLVTYTDAAGDAWLDFGTKLVSQAFAPPPPPPEFTDQDYRVVAYAKDLPGVNPVILTENTLDHAHLFHVHAVHFVPGPPKVTLKTNSAPGSGLATYEWAPSGRYQLTIENEFHVPFTTSLRFLVTDTQTGKRSPALVLWFTAAPTGDGVRLHLRIARAVLTCPAFDGLFKLVDELPLAEDVAIVRTVDARAWGTNALTPDDAFVAQYRAEMTRDYPDVLRHYVHFGGA
jgi:hypothetical protein